MIQRSRSTGAHVFYPRVAAPFSGATDLEWVAASGLATIYSITVNRAKTGNNNVAIVQLDEGPRMMTRIEGVETAPIGTRVKAQIIEIDGDPAVVFGLVAGGKS
ncbi:MAG: OB-fold domain-containing protein [Hyphomicrobiaceae bacterium]